MDNTNITERSLAAVLSKLKMRELPEERKEGDGDIWTKAVALVYKADCTRSYAVVRNSLEGRPVVISDFGTSSMIRKVEKIYPFAFLGVNDIPSFSNRTQMLEYLVNNGEKEAEINKLLSSKDSEGNPKTKEQREADKAELRKRVVKCATINSIRNN